VPKIPGIRQKDAIRVFEKLGFRVARQSGPVIMTNGKTRLVIPRHNPINAVCETATGKEIFFAAPFPFALFFDLPRYSAWSAGKKVLVISAFKLPAHSPT
jgi:predicted RNA binding protein YcfA (HicA-like mRNA interferase family)